MLKKELYLESQDLCKQIFVWFCVLTLIVIIISQLQLMQVYDRDLRSNDFMGSSSFTLHQLELDK